MGKGGSAAEPPDNLAFPRVQRPRRQTGYMPRAPWDSHVLSLILMTATWEPCSVSGEATEQGLYPRSVCTRARALPLGAL